MNGNTLDDLVADRLRGVNLSSTASKKFDALIEALAAHREVPPNSIVAKFLAHPKNHGNRISEGTSGTPARLVLLADEPIVLDAAGHAFGRRARFRHSRSCSQRTGIDGRPSARCWRLAPRIPSGSTCPPRASSCRRHASWIWECARR